MEKLSFPPVPSPDEELTDWRYRMRREMQEIIPGLFLGPYAAAMKSKRGILQAAGITHIVCIRQDVEASFIRPNFPGIFTYLIVDIADSVQENIIHHIPKVNDFISYCLQQGGKVLVHGNGGISRSAAMVIAFMMENYGLSYKDAFSYVQARRFCINPNEAFANQLMEYEPIYKARLSHKNGQRSFHAGSLKRKDREEDEMMEGRENMMV